MILFSGHRVRVQTANTRQAMTFKEAAYDEVPNTSQAMTFKEAAYDEVSNVDDKLYYIAVK